MLCSRLCLYMCKCAWDHTHLSVILEASRTVAAQQTRCRTQCSLCDGYTPQRASICRHVSSQVVFPLFCSLGCLLRCFFSLCHHFSDFLHGLRWFLIFPSATALVSSPDWPVGCASVHVDQSEVSAPLAERSLPEPNLVQFGSDSTPHCVSPVVLEDCSFTFSL